MQNKSVIRFLKIIWSGFVSNTLIFLAVIYFFVAPHENPPENTGEYSVFLYFAYLIIIASIPLSYWIYKKQIKQCPENAEESVKLNYYRKGMIMKYAFLELGAIFGIMAYFSTGTLTPLYMFVIPMIIFFISRPSYSRFKEDFGMKKVINADFIVPKEDIEYEKQTKAPDGEAAPEEEKPK